MIKRSNFQLFTQGAKSLQLEHIEDDESGSPTQNEPIPEPEVDQQHDDQLNIPQAVETQPDIRPVEQITYLPPQELNYFEQQRALLDRSSSEKSKKPVENGVKSPSRKPPARPKQPPKPKFQQTTDQFDAVKAFLAKNLDKKYDELEAPPEKKNFFKQAFKDPFKESRPKRVLAAEVEAPPQEQPVDGNLVKALVGLRIKQDKRQYLIEKHSGTKNWKEEAVLQSKGYAIDIQGYNAFLCRRIWCALYRKQKLAEDETRYHHSYCISKSNLMPETLVHFRGVRYPARWEAFDLRLMKKAKRQKFQQQPLHQEDEEILEFHKLKLNKHLPKNVFVESCEKGETEIQCNYWFDGDKYTKPITEVQDLYPAELACHIYEKLKKEQQKK